VPVIETQMIPWLILLSVGVIDGEFLRHAGTEVVHHHVGGFDQAVKNFLALGSL